MPDPLNPYASPADTAPQEQPPVVDDLNPQPPGVKVPHGWGLAASIGLGLSVMILSISLVLQFRLLELYWGVTSAEEIDPTTEGWVLDSINKLFILSVFVRLPTAVAFITWMYRAHRNLPGLGHAKLDSYQIWVVLCWLIPIMNWFAPYQVMREIWNRSQPLPVAGNEPKSPGMVSWWWGLWLASAFSSILGNYLDRHIDTVTQASLAVRCDVLTLATGIACGVLAILIIHRINRYQVARYRQMS